LSNDNYHEHKIAVVIPCYRVKKSILGVLDKIGPEISMIYVVDDCCPENTGEYVEANCNDHRVIIIKNDCNKGVGGAVLKGYAAAISDGSKIIVKIDGDGQMDPSQIKKFIRPIIEGKADYTKGNRFFYLDEIKQMPKIRVFGNAVLSFMSKLSTGYWSIFDPTNGYTAIHANVARHLPLDKLSNGYFFESDMLFRLNTIKAKVVDIPMHAFYGEEKSNLNIIRVIIPFAYMHSRNFYKRLFYNYFLRDLNLASFELISGSLLMLFGFVYGINAWMQSLKLNLTTPAGTVMLAALPIIIGLQLLLNFISYDMSNQPLHPIFLYLDSSRQ
jgi:dolichol-phosphate mannosyltransferase